MTKLPVRDPKRCPAHPGRILREYAVPALKLSKTAIAEHLGVSRQTLYDILNEKQPITATMALRIGKLCGNGPEIWLNLQKRYDLRMAEAELGDALDAIPLLRAA